jgi:tight adherence protein C
VSADLLLALAGVFICVAALTGWATAQILQQRTPEHQRIRRTVDLAAFTVAAAGARLALDGAPLRWQLIESRLPRSARDMGRLRRRLLLAGYKWPGAPSVLALAELVLPPLLGGMPLLFLGTTLPGWMAAGLGAVLGFIGPGLWLDWRVEARKWRIRDGLPDTLDLLVVCLEAGSSVDQAIVKSTVELEIAYPDIADELRLVISEIRAGKSRNDAFKGFAQRTKLDEVRSLATMLVQTERFGTSIAQALRAHADSVRTQRRQRAEEQASKVAIKLVFPLVIFLFPALYIVLLGHVVLEMIRTFQ